MNGVILPQAITPGQFAERFGWSEKHVRKLAKRLGACRILGNRMTLLPDDVQTLVGFTKCRSGSTSGKHATAALYTTTGAQLPATDYAARLAQRIKSSPRELGPRSKTGTTKVVSLIPKKS
jgi:hypothetical protein